MQIFITSVINGLSLGAIYATVGMSLVLIFKATAVLNFAQGEMAMFGAFIAYVLHAEQGLAVGWAIALAVVISAVLAAGVERVLVRPLPTGDPLPVVLVTLGLFYIVNAIAGDVWNFQARVFPPILQRYPTWMPGIGGGRFFEIGGARVFATTAVLVIGLALIIVSVHLVLTKTKVGLAFRGVSSNLESASLVGISPGRVMQFGWALAAAVGTLGASLVAPVLTLQPNMMATVLIYSLAGAALGGLDSVGGTVLGGLIVGLVQSVGVTWLVVIQLGQSWVSVLQLGV
ncbi:MAG: branched-chain amino acid ABC transporter permease, partial [Actinomycetota bacterium]|nr:branched-chain amino acid ABC transporter permease [Actinomycetota bacterium]